MAGRKPIPTHLKLVRGNPGRRPLPAREPKARPCLPDAPAPLEGEALAEYQRVGAELAAIGVMTSLDRAALAAYCTAYARWVEAERALAASSARDADGSGMVLTTAIGNVVQNPLVGIANRAAVNMVRFAAEFGMTPSARSRIIASPIEGEDETANKYFPA